MPRLAFKHDSSFFRKIATGAVGTRAVLDDLAGRGHRPVELERGSADTKIWKDVKRKRVRIPDVVCLRCGRRAESRAKTKPGLSMSHSLEAERAWDYGMVDDDLVAIPICRVADEAKWAVGRLEDDVSYWHERNWLQWEAFPYVNYFTVADLRATAPTKSSTKGVTEGSETSLAWGAIFSTRSGAVHDVDDGTIRLVTPGRSSYRWRNEGGLPVRVEAGQDVAETQVLASAVPPASEIALGCRADLSVTRVEELLRSRERTQRFTGVKLARLLGQVEHHRVVAALAHDDEEDFYVRLEGVAYLLECAGEPAHPLLAPYLEAVDEPTQLEAVITLGEVGTSDAVAFLSRMLHDDTRPFFLRSAAAWALGQVGADAAVESLVGAFGALDHDLRQEALEGLVQIGEAAGRHLLGGLREGDDVAAGCAEALRRLGVRDPTAVTRSVLDAGLPESSVWPVWLLGQLPRSSVKKILAGLSVSPEVDYALKVLWTFAESWVAETWEQSPGAVFPPRLAEAEKANR